jgi:hypothetical protein
MIRDMIRKRNLAKLLRNRLTVEVQSKRNRCAIALKPLRNRCEIAVH